MLESQCTYASLCAAFGADDCTALEESLQNSLAKQLCKQVAKLCGRCMSAELWCDIYDRHLNVSKAVSTHCTSLCAFTLAVGC